VSLLFSVFLLLCPFLTILGQKSDSSCANNAKFRYHENRDFNPSLRGRKAVRIFSSPNQQRKVLPMSIQGALTDLMKVFIAFYIGFCLIGRPDIPLKMVSQLRAQALKGTTESWHCPSIFNRSGDCRTYNPANYK